MNVSPRALWPVGQAAQKSRSWIEAVSLCDRMVGWGASEDVKEYLRRDSGKRGNCEVCFSDALGWTDADDVHAGRQGCFDTACGIFDHNAVLRNDVQCGCGQHEHLRIGF